MSTTVIMQIKDHEDPPPRPTLTYHISAASGFAKHTFNQQIALFCAHYPSGSFVWGSILDIQNLRDA
eukprot:scaffold13840_cov69-Cyclotella_meneghiniana.AAC.4